MTKTALFWLFCACGVAAFGSTITGVTVSFATSTTVTENNFSVRGDGMGAMKITAQFSDQSFNCTWVTASASCTDSTNFSVSFPQLEFTDPDVSHQAGFWTITDLGGDTNPLLSLTINALAGNVAFDRCLTTAGFDDTNHGGTVCDNAGDRTGTTNSADGWSAGSASAAATGGISAAALYTNSLHTSDNPPLCGVSPPTPCTGDAWGVLKLTFDGSFVSQDTFTFRADTDIVKSQVADTPEPGTLGLIGAALAGLGALRFRRR